MNFNLNLWWPNIDFTVLLYSLGSPPHSRVTFERKTKTPRVQKKGRGNVKDRH